MELFQHLDDIRKQIKNAYNFFLLFLLILFSEEIHINIKYKLIEFKR